MKLIYQCLIFVLLTQPSRLFAQIPAEDADPSPFINKVGMGLGVVFPIGSGVLRDGAYPFGFNIYINLTHTTTNGQDYELRTGAEILADASGGVYLALPVMVNRIFKLTNFGGSPFGIDGFAGLGYSYQCLFPRTEGITIKNQHTFGLDAGVAFTYALGNRWDLNMRTGIFRSFTRPVELNYSGTSITSADKFNYTTLPITIGVARRIGEK